MKRSIILIVGMLLFFLTARCQIDSSRQVYKRSFWAEGGAGTAHQNLAITGCASFEVIRSLLVSYEFDGSFDAGYAIGEPTTTDTESRGFSLGYLAKHKQMLFYFTAGATKIKGVFRDESTERDFDVWSMKLRVGFLYTWEYVAIGVTPYININSEIQYAGITANLAFGRFIKFKN
ncbi:MAG: hypothetical protein JXR07_02715 [Reichenbachiella sp.]